MIGVFGKRVEHYSGSRFKSGYDIDEILQFGFPAALL
jgi:hypothetical protein